MKKGVYFLLGIIITSMFKKSEEDDTAMDHCATTQDHTALCYKNNQNVIPVIASNLPSNIMRFILHNEHSTIPWLISSIDTFKKYPNLNSLFIRSSLQFSPEFHDPHMKELLTSDLFNIPQMTNFTLHNCKFEGMHDVEWTLPASLERFHSVNSTISGFIFKNCPSLQELHIKSCNLTKMPKLHYPEPPIHTLNLLGNPLLNLTVYDIAALCNLSKISFDVTGTFLGSDAGHCECNLLKKWYQWLNDMKVTVICHVPNEWSCSWQEKNCSIYSLDKAKEIYNRTCVKEDPSTVTVKPDRGITSLWSFVIPLVMLILLITLGIYMATLTKMRPESKIEAIEEHESEENEDSEDIVTDYNLVY